MEFVVITDDYSDDGIIKASKAIFTESIEQQQAALKHFFHDDNKKRFLHNIGDTAFAHMFKKQLLHKTNQILSTSNDFSLKAEALTLMASTCFGQPPNSFDLVGFTLESLVCAEEDDLDVVLESLNYVMCTEKESLAACLISYGIIDVLCMRLPSISKADVGRKIISFLLDFIKKFHDKQLTEGVKACTIVDIILKEPEGMLANEENQLICLAVLRGFVVDEHCLEMFMMTNLPTTLVNRLRTDTRPHIQLGIANVLLNVTGSDKDKCKKLVEAGILHILMSILQTKDCDNKMLDSTISIVANITGDCLELRDQVIEVGLAGMVVAAANQPSLSISYQRTLAWALENIFYVNAKGVPMELSKEVLRCQAEYLKDTEDKVIYAHIMNAVGFLLCPNEGRLHETVDFILELNLIPNIINAMKKQDSFYSKRSHDVVLKIVNSGKEAAIKELLEHGLCTLLGDRGQEFEGESHENVVDLLHCLAQAGYSQQIMKEIPASFIANLVRNEMTGAEKALDIFLIMLKDASPSVNNYLDDQMLSDLYEYLEAKEAHGLCVLVEKVIKMISPDQARQTDGNTIDVD